MLPQSFSESELDSVRESYSAFVDHYAAECGIDNPDELRDEVERIGNVGELLKVDTQEAQDALRETADEIEKEEHPRWEDDENSGSVIHSDTCTDGELESMFSTLGK